jgi:glycosyltransferase involved in cell wall biosynthesis
VAVFLFLLPVNNLILHERGTIWNFPSSRKMLLKFVAWKAHLILANSNATKTMLEQKFSIPSEKIKVLHNGIYVPTKHTKKITRDSSTLFRLGFIGRLDTPKGVHVLIDAMRILGGNDIKLIIAGDGALEDNLKEQAYNIENISFIGRVAEPYSFLNSIDLLVVPSIREPLGNVCLEAGLCKVPVLAANIDGLPEIIEDKISGELIDATDEVSVQLSKGSVSLPEFVVDPISNQLRPPKQINPSLLARKILKLSLEPDNLKHYAEKLHDKVVKYFNIQRYGKELHTIYYEIKQKKTSSKKTS